MDVRVCSKECSCICNFSRMGIVDVYGMNIEIVCIELTMPIATLTLELAIEHAQSLKDRRQVVRSLKEKLRHGFNVSVAELDEAVVWNRATLGVAAISGSSSYLSGQLREVESAARRICVGLGCEIVDSYVEADVVLEATGDPDLTG